MQVNLAAFFLVLTIGATIPACNRYDVIPDQLKKWVNKDVSYQDIQRAPDLHQGRLVVLGGNVQSTTRVKDRSQIEVLPLSSTDEYIPYTDEQSQSQGRFYTYDSGKEILDLTGLSEDTRITVVGR